MWAPIICISGEEYGYVKVKVSSFVSNGVRIRFPPTMLLHKAGMVFLSIKERKRERIKNQAYGRFGAVQHTTHKNV